MIIADVGRIEAWPIEIGEADSTVSFTAHKPDATWTSWASVDSTPILSFDEPHIFRRSDHLFAGIQAYIPWRFEPVGKLLSISSGGLGSAAADSIVGGRGARVYQVTDVIPTSGVLMLIDPSQIRFDTTPIVEEAHSLTLVAPGLHRRILRVAPTIWRETPKDPEAAAALKAADDLASWLGRSDDEIADICHYAIRSARYWARGTVPRPATVRRLYETHSLISAIVRRLGRVRTRQWFNEPTEDGVTRLEILASDDGIRMLASDVASILYSSGRVDEAPRSETEETALAEAAARGYDPSSFINREAKRPRKPSS